MEIKSALKTHFSHIPACFSVILCLFIYSCTGNKNKDKKTVFSYNEPAGITSLDPAFCSRTENIWAVHQLFSGLVELNDQLNIVPAIAKAWNISDDGLVYTFSLRNDVYFHHHPAFIDGKGRRVTAHDFVYSFNRITDKKTASPGMWIFDFVLRINQNTLNVQPVNDSTLIIKLKAPYRPFINLLTMPYAYVVPKEVTEYYGTDFGRNPVGTGPFTFKVWAENEKLVLLKNPFYYEHINGERLPYLDAVNVYFLKDRQTGFMEFIKGKFDFMSGIDGSFKEELLTASGGLQRKYKDDIVMNRIPYLKTDYLGFNLDDSLSPVSDFRIRKAISYAIDRKKMLKYLRNNIGVPAENGFVPDVLKSPANNTLKWTHCPDSVFIWLKRAGYPMGKGLPEIKLVTTAVYLDLCEFIQGALAKYGITVRTEVLTAAVNAELIANNKVSLFRKSWVADYADSENFLSLFYSENFSPGGPNYSHFRLAAYDSLYKKLLLHANAGAKEELILQMEEIISRYVPVIPLYHDEAVFFYRRHIKGLVGNSINLLNLKKVRSERRHENE